MSLYRCAACGSPNVVTDTQNDGVKYDYLKGAVGTVILGAGGAAAGITNKSSQVFVCPDCGVTLSYPMPESIKNLIDLGVMSEDARKKLSLNGMPVNWDVLRRQYKNIESGYADEAIERRSQNTKDFLLSYATATQEEFDKAVDAVVHYNEYVMFDDEGEYRDAPISLEEFYAYQSAIAIVIENAVKYLPYPLPERHEYRGFTFADGRGTGFTANMKFKNLFWTYFHEKMRVEFGESIYKLRSEDFCTVYTDIDPFICTYATAYFPLDYDAKWDDYIEDACDKLTASGRSAGNFFSKLNLKIFDSIISVIVPRFTVKNGRLGYHCGSQEGNFIGLSDHLMDDYLAAFPEKKQIFDEKTAEFKAEHDRVLEHNKSIDKRIETLQHNITQAEEEIFRMQKEVSTLKGKIFGKKAALAKAAELEEEIRKLKASIETDRSAIENLKEEHIKETSSRDFAYELAREMDYFIIWHWVDENGDGAEHYAE